jgi:hypothetical protein
MKIFICVTLLILSTVSIGHTIEIGIAWEFNHAGDAEGWQIINTLNNLRISDGTLKATVIGDWAQLVGPVMELPARNYGMLQIRMRVEGPQSAVVSWNGDSTFLGFEKFSVTGDGVFHEYDIPLFKKSSWLGQIHQLNRLTMLARIGTEIEIDYIRIVRLGVKSKVISFKPLRTVLKQGDQIPWSAIIGNSGDAPGSIRSRLYLPDEFQLVEGVAETDHGILSPDDTDTLNWNFRGDQAGTFQIRLSVVSNEDTTESVYEAEVVDEYWRQQEFFLSAWSPPYAWYPPPYDEQVFDYYHKANFDMVLWVAPTDEAMSIVEKFNMKCLLIVTNLIGGDAYLRADDDNFPPVITDEMLANLDPVIEKYRHHPNVIGYFIVDEPRTPAFQNLGKVVNYLRKKDPARLGFINLFPGDDDEYDQYVESFLDVTKPELLSYDRYIFHNGRDGDYYFYNLATIRKWAMRYGIPFCNIIQAIGTDMYNLNWRTPNEAEHRWLVYTSLAYGVKALIWFHWHADWGVTGSPDRDQIFTSLQKVNAEINQLGPHLLNLQSLGVYHTGTGRLGGQPLPIDSWVESGSPERNLVIGLFKDNTNRDFMMVTNASYRDSVTCRIIIHAEIEDLQYFDVQLDNWIPIDYEATPDGATFTVPLRAGGGKLIEVHRATAVRVGNYSSSPSPITLSPNYPNPFNQGTRIQYSLAKPSLVELKIYNIKGDEVKTLVKAHQTAGNKEIIWDGRDNAGRVVSSGIYFYSLGAFDQTLRRKMLLLK